MKLIFAIVKQTAGVFKSVAVVLRFQGHELHVLINFYLSVFIFSLCLLGVNFSKRP